MRKSDTLHGVVTSRRHGTLRLRGNMSVQKKGGKGAPDSLLMMIHSDRSFGIDSDEIIDVLAIIIPFALFPKMISNLSVSSLGRLGDSAGLGRVP